jgi:hypothetical protein
MAWLTGWTYRKSITLSRASGAVTNYQMKLLVGESSGATGEDVDCNSHALATFADLRFTTSDGSTLLDYWIESITGTTPNGLATVWIEFDSIGTGDTTFYMYYGKADAVDASSGENTFIVFDDFERGNDGDDVGGSWTVTAGVDKISTTEKFGGTRSCKMGDATNAGDMNIPVTASANISIGYRLWKHASNIANITHGNGSKVLQVRVVADETMNYYTGSGYTDIVGALATAAVWELYEVSDIIFGTSIDVWHNDVRILNDGAVNWSAAFSPNQARLSIANIGQPCYLDNFRVRHFRPTEPAWGSWGAETTQTTTAVMPTFKYS